MLRKKQRDIQNAEFQLRRNVLDLAEYGYGISRREVHCHSEAC